MSQPNRLLRPLRRSECFLSRRLKYSLLYSTYNLNDLYLVNSDDTVMHCSHTLFMMTVCGAGDYISFPLPGTNTSDLQFYTHYGVEYNNAYFNGWAFLIGDG